MLTNSPSPQHNDDPARHQAGFIWYDTKPDKCTVRELKQCENCPQRFVRDAGSGQKYCFSCISHCLEQEQNALTAVIDVETHIQHRGDF